MRAGTVLVVALALGATTALLPPPASAQSLSKDKIRVAIGVDAAYSPIYYAKQAKLFEAAGLNIEAMQFTQGGDAIDAIAAGQTELGGAAEPTTLIRAARADIKVLAIYGQSPTYIKLLVKPEITDPKQLKKIGIVPGSVSEFSVERMLTKYGIAPASVQFVKAGPPEFPALFARGDVDGYFLWEPWPTNGLKQGGKILMTSGDVGYAYNMWLSCSGSWLATHQAEAKALLGALAQACKAIDADLSKGAAAVQAEAKIPAATALEALKEIKCVVRDFTADDIATYESIAGFLAERKITAGKVDVRKVLQTGFFAGN